MISVFVCLSLSLSLTQFCSRLKTFIFCRAYGTVILSVAVTVLIVGVRAYTFSHLLTYSHYLITRLSYADCSKLHETVKTNPIVEVVTKRAHV